MGEERTGQRIIHRELSYGIVGCAQNVHRVLGPGFPEGVYHRAICCELMRAGIPFETEKVVEVFYEGTLCGTFKPDLLVDGKVIVELKATNLNLAILINFGRSSLETRRVVL